MTLRALTAIRTISTAVDARSNSRSLVGRWPMLDGLRGVAVLLVVAAHIGMPGKGGPVGVTLFFVLSGFLITNLLLEEEAATGMIDLPIFYMRRLLRLLPALGVYLLGSAVLAATFGMGWSWIWNETWPPLFYIGNYAQVFGVELQMHWHTWSLAVEEHFYLVWPFVLIVLPIRHRLRIATVGVIVLAAWSVLSAHLIPGWGYAATDTNAYALGSGCLVALGRRQGLRIAFPAPYPVLGVVLLVALTAVPSATTRQLVVVVVSALTIWACVEAEPGVLAHRYLRWMGRISYALYLWHVPLLMVAGSSLLSRIGAAIAAMFLAWLSWNAIERPLLTYRDKRWKRRQMPDPLNQLNALATIRRSR